MVATDAFYNPTGPEGRPHMAVLGGRVAHLTRDEAKRLFAQLGISLAAELTGSERDQLAAEADRIAADDQRRCEEWEALFTSNESLPIDGGAA